MTCKIVPDMTYNVSSGTLSLYTTYLITPLRRAGKARVLKGSMHCSAGHSRATLSAVEMRCKNLSF